MSSLQVSVLGPLRIELDGAPVQFDTRKAAALVTYLAVEGQPSSRAALAAIFWPDYDSQRAFHNLRRILWSCNQALGKGWLEAGTESIALRRESGFWLDTEAFQAHLRRCGQVPGPSDSSPDCLSALTAAAELYRGDFMAGFTLPDSPPFDEWQFFHREHWKTEFSQVLVKLVQGRAGRGELEDALQFARRWLALDPLNEPATIELMHLYIKLGQRAAALRQYGTLVQTLEKELGVAPQPETTALYQQIRSGAAAAGLPQPPSEPAGGITLHHSPGWAQVENSSEQHPSPSFRPPSNLPVALTPFVGRERELADISRLIDEPTCQLLTLLGPGGIGKTRLAIQAASEKENAFAQGACFVPLAPLTEAEHMVSAIAAALQAPFSGTGKALLQQLLDFIRQKQVLMILDNFEHLISSESLSLLLELIASAPQVKILVTSRQRLNLHGEHILSIAGLEMPKKSMRHTIHPESAAYSALRLFNQSARRVQPDFELREDNLPPVITICQAVQGMPLGIELAAAWLDLLSPAEIAIEIQKNLDFLETSQRDIPERQRSIRAIFNATWGLLSPPEQEVFKNLSVFQGGFTRQAGEVVARASLRDLAALGNKALLHRRPPERYEIHELLRQYAAEALRGDPSQWQAVRQQHSRFYLQQLEAYGQVIHGPGYLAARDGLEPEIDNLRAAWQYAVERRQFTQIDAALYGFCFFWSSRALYDELNKHLWEAAHALDAPTPSRQEQLLSIKIQTVIARNTYDMMTDYVPQLLRGNLATIRALGAEQELGPWYILLAWEYGWRVNPQEGIQMLEQELDGLRSAGDERGLASTLQALASLRIRVGEIETAKNNLAEAISICDRRGDRVNQAENYHFLADLLFQERAYEEAKSVLQQRRKIYADFGEKVNAMFTLQQMGRLGLALGEYEQAVQIFHEAVELAQVTGLINLEAASLSWESIASLRLGNLDRARQVRLASLAISRKINELTDIIWGLYELGEIERVSGNQEAAGRAYQECRQLFHDREMTEVLAFYHKGMGDLSLARRRRVEARQHFQESLAYAQRDYNFWCAAYATDGLGRVALEQGDFPSARAYLKEALEKALEVGDRTLVMVPLAHLACLSAALGEYERAAGLSAFVIHHPASWQETRTQAQQVLITAARHLPAQILAAAQARGRLADLETVVQLLIADPFPQDLE